MYMDLGIPMKVEIQSDRSMENSLTDRLGQDPERSKLIHENLGYKNAFKVVISVLKRVPTAKKFTNVGTTPVSASVLQRHCKFAVLVFN